MQKHTAAKLPVQSTPAAAATPATAPATPSPWYESADQAPAVAKHGNDEGLLEQVSALWTGMLDALFGEEAADEL